MQTKDEHEAIRRRYAESEAYKAENPGRDGLLDPYMVLKLQEKHRAIVRCLRQSGMEPLADKRLLEVGCGKCWNLHQFLGMGFRGENVFGNELREHCLEIGKHLLPDSVTLLPGDAAQLQLEDESFDVVYQSTMFSSILDDRLQEKIATRMWALTKPGGGVLWYDFVYNNPPNEGVRGVSFRRICQLFPDGEITRRRVILAPPISRRITKWWPPLYTLFNILPFLRTHVLCWIKKPDST